MRAIKGGWSLGAGDGLAVLEAEEVLEELLYGKGQAGDVAEGGGGFFEAGIGVGFAGGGGGGAGVQGVVADGGHKGSRLKGVVSRVREGGRGGCRGSSKVRGEGWLPQINPVLDHERGWNCLRRYVCVP